MKRKKVERLRNVKISSNKVIKVDNFIIDDETIKNVIEDAKNFYKELELEVEEFVGIHFLFIVKDREGNKYLAKHKIEKKYFNEKF